MVVVLIVRVLVVVVEGPLLLLLIPFLLLPLLPTRRSLMADHGSRVLDFIFPAPPLAAPAPQIDLLQGPIWAQIGPNTSLPTAHPPLITAPQASCFATNTADMVTTMFTDATIRKGQRQRGQVVDLARETNSCGKCCSREHSLGCSNRSRICSGGSEW